MKSIKHSMSLGVIAGAVLMSGCVTSDSHSAPVAMTKKTKTIHHTVKTDLWIKKHPVKKHRALPHNFSGVISRLQDLGYLPITQAFIHGKNGTRIRHDAFLWSVPAPLQHAVDDYAWNRHNPFIRSAVIQFERQNGILGPKGVSEGNLHPNVIQKLFSKTAHKNAYPFQWVYVTKAVGTNQLEQLHVWQHGLAFAPASFGGIEKGFAIRNNYVWGTVVNTGVLGATPNGTWPIYQRLPVTTMRGVFPIPISYGAYQSLAGQQVPQWAGSSLMQPARGMVDGHPVKWQPYNDPGILWVNYFDNGRGMHYYPRASYGFPQSAGCVEQPYNSAPVTYNILHYGVPVTISKAVFHGDGIIQK